MHHLVFETWMLTTAGAAVAAQLIVVAVFPGTPAVAGLAIVGGLAAAALARPRRAGGPVPPSVSGAWERLAEECVGVIDDLDRLTADGPPPQRDVADHAASRLREVLERAGVSSIDGDAAFDRSRHSPVGPARPGDRVVETLSPGFRIGPRVLRRARVRVARIPPAEHGADR